MLLSASLYFSLSVFLVKAAKTHYSHRVALPAAAEKRLGGCSTCSIIRLPPPLPSASPPPPLSLKSEYLGAVPGIWVILDWQGKTKNTLPRYWKMARRSRKASGNNTSVPQQPQQQESLGQTFDPGAAEGVKRFERPLPKGADGLTSSGDVILAREVGPPICGFQVSPLYSECLFFAAPEG